MKKPTQGFDVNVDDFIEANTKKYPNFESVNAGYWLYGQPKKLLKDVLEDRKTNLFYISNIMNSISTLETLTNLNNDLAKDGVEPKDAKFRNASYDVALNQLRIDLKEYKNNYAKTFVFEQLLKLKLKEDK